MRRLALLALLALLVPVVACGRDPTDPPSRVPTLGRYAFTFSSQPGTLGTYRDQGTLTLTAATAADLTGSLASTGANFGPGQAPNSAPLQSIGWNVDAYVVVASMPYGNYTLRVTRGGGNDLTCEGRLQPGGTVTGYLATCTATYQGP